MKITFEPNTKETRLNDLNRRYKFNKINDTLYTRAENAIKKGKTVIYTVNAEGKVLSISTKKTETLKDNNKNLAIDKKRAPYNDKGKTNFNIRNRAGVYVIYEKKVLVYVGFSHKDVYKALYRHFQQWKDKTQQRIVFHDLKHILVRVVYCKSGAKAKSLEGALIIKHRPELNINKYLEFTTDEKEKALLKELDNTHEGIYQFKGDLPF